MSIIDPFFDALGRFVGQADGPARQAGFPVSLAQIRCWTEAFDDDNPAYRDEEAARAAGRSGIVAPPAMLSIFTTRGYRETLAQTRGEGSPLFRLLHQEGYITPGSSLIHEYGAAIALGDRVHDRSLIEAISPRKQTRLGEGYFITRRTDYWNDRGDILGVQRLGVFAFRPNGRLHLEGGQDIASPLQGEPLSPQAIHLDRLGVIACTMACSDFNAGHYDPDIARAFGFEEIFIDIQTALGFAQIYATRHARPQQRVRRIALHLGVPYYAGDVLTLSGARRSQSDGEEITVLGRCKNGVHLKGMVSFGL